MKKHVKLSVALCALLAPGMVMAVNQTWVNWQADNDWANPGNWNGLAVPTAGDEAHFNVGAGLEAIVSDPGQVSARVVMDNSAAVTIATGGNLVVGGQALIGSSSAGSVLLVDGGFLSVGTEFAVGNGSSGTLIVNSGTVNANGGWLAAGNGGSGVITINGGDVNVLNHMYLGIGGSGNVTVNGGTLDMGGQLIGALTGGQIGNLTIAGGTTTAAVLDFNNAGTSTLDLTGGQLVITGGLGQDADSTFNVGAGELLFTGLALADVNWAIDNGGGTWTFAGANGNVRSVTDDGFGTITVTAIPEPATMGLMALVGGALLGFRRMFA